MKRAAVPGLGMGYASPVSRAAHLVSSLCFVFAAAVALAGCPREVQEPDPGEGTPCGTLADCNMGVSCGDRELRVCVDGLCEESPSVVSPCSGSRDAGP